MKINHDSGKDVQIKWYFEEGDESIEELGNALRANHSDSL